MDLILLEKNIKDLNDAKKWCEFTAQKLGQKEQRQSLAYGRP